MKNLAKERKDIEKIENSKLTYISFIITLIFALTLIIFTIKKIIESGFDLANILFLIAMICLDYLAIDFFIRVKRRRK